MRVQTIKIKVVSANTIPQLEQNVNLLLRSNWQLHGDMVCHDNVYSMVLKREDYFIRLMVIDNDE